MKICFCVPESTEYCNPEIVAALRTVKNHEELDAIVEEYSWIEVIDAMFGLYAEEENVACYAMDIDNIMDWLFDQFFEEILPIIKEGFLNRYNPEWVYQMR